MDQHNPVSRLNALGRLNDIVRGCCHLMMAASFLVFVCATPGLADEERLERADQNREEARVSWGILMFFGIPETAMWIFSL